ncbi:MAG TPA: hypothetical protein VLV45_12175 [Gemmatimonadales bacterium]|nr:hypothetical protein [Gemmatimonadales bacterium]
MTAYRGLSPPRKTPDSTMAAVIQKWRRARLEHALARLLGVDPSRPWMANVEAARDILRGRDADAA